MADSPPAGHVEDKPALDDIGIAVDRVMLSQEANQDHNGEPPNHRWSDNKEARRGERDINFFQTTSCQRRRGPSHRASEISSPHSRGWQRKCPRLGSKLLRLARL